MRQLQSECLKKDKVARAAIVVAWGLCLLASLLYITSTAANPAWPDDDGDWFGNATIITPSAQEKTTPSTWMDRLNSSGYLKNETAYRYDEPRSITKIRNIFSFKIDYPLTDNLNLVAAAWAYYDLAYKLFDYETISARSTREDDKPLVFVDGLAQERDSPGIDLREFYLDLFLDDIDIRLGRQFIIWGVFEGIRITDEINPLDFRELVMPELLDYRIPLWSAKIDYYHNEDSWQFIWIPDIRFHKPAPRGSEWELLQEVSGTTATGKEYFTTYPASYTLATSEFGLRYKTTIFDAEISLSYFHTWDDFAVIFRSVKIDSSLDPDFFPTYTRINIFGATMVKPVGDTILKMELAWVPDKYFGLERGIDRDNDGYLDGDGVVKLKHYRWGLGVDFNVWGIDMSPAITQWVILDYKEGLIQDEDDTSLTLFARKPLPEQSAVLELLVIALINMNEVYLKPKATFDITNQFKIAVGMDLFYGLRSTLGVSATSGAITSLTAVEQSAQFFGNFHNNDRVFFEFKYTF